MGLLKRSLDLYEALGAETGQAVDLHRCGSVRIATSDDRLHQFEQVLGDRRVVGVPMGSSLPEQARELLPLLDVTTCSARQTSRPTGTSIPRA